MAIFSLQGFHTVPSLWSHLCVHISPFYSKDSSPTGPTLVTVMLTHYIYGDLISKEGHILSG